MMEEYYLDFCRAFRLFASLPLLFGFQPLWDLFCFFFFGFFFFCLTCHHTDSSRQNPKAFPLIYFFLVSQKIKLTFDTEISGTFDARSHSVASRNACVIGIISFNVKFVIWPIGHIKMLQACMGENGRENKQRD